MPPSTDNDWPVVNDESSQSSHRTAFATSSVLPSLAIGIIPEVSAFSSFGLLLIVFFISSVPRVGPGQTALTRMPAAAFSKAAVLVRAITAALLGP